MINSKKNKIKVRGTGCYDPSDNSFGFTPFNEAPSTQTDAKNVTPLAAQSIERWCNTIESMFDVFPCLREVCEPHPRRLWPFLLFASAAMMGSCMDLTYYYFYANEGERTRLNYINLGVGDPTLGKHSLERLMNQLLAPIIAESEIADESTNTWKEDTDAKGANLK